MQDQGMAPQNKPAEMSFSDWKKMKSALNTNEENKASKTDPPRNRHTTNAKANNNVRNNNNYGECRLPYFEQLRRNNPCLFGGNTTGYCDIMPFPPVPASSSSVQHRMNYFNQPLYIARSQSYPKNNFPGSNNFVMARGGIPQQPFPNRSITSTHQILSNSQHKAATKRSAELQTKQPTSVTTTAVKTANTEPLSKNEIQTTAKSKSKKQKRGNAKPPKPPVINATANVSKEERQRMWREYRQQIKPFKNREYHNAKRVVQRLGKKNADELDEKEKERLARAQETVTAHKAMLAEKAAKRWTLTSQSAATSTTSTLEKPSSSGYVPIATQPSTNETSSSTSNSVNDSNTKQTSETVQASGSQWGLWNNFIPGGVIFNSTE